MFDEVRKRFDPANVSHPVLDLQILRGKTEREHWSPVWSDIESHDLSTLEEIDQVAKFEQRKRAYYFFHAGGEDLYKISDHRERRFHKLLAQGMGNGEDIIRWFFVSINKLFRAKEREEDDRLTIWKQHRFDTERDRLVFFSSHSRGADEFEVRWPKYMNPMAQAFKAPGNHVRICLRERNDFIELDFQLFQLLEHARMGLPALVLETAPVGRIWNFMENLPSTDNSPHSSEHIICEWSRGCLVKIKQRDDKYFAATAEV